MHSSNPLGAFSALRALPRVIWVTAVATLINRAGTMAIPFLALFLVQERSYASADAGKFLALFGIVAFTAGPISGYLVDRYGAKRVILASFLFAGSLVMLVPYARGTLMLALSIAGWALANEIFRPAMLTHLGEAVPADQRKQAFVVNRWATNLGMSIGPAVGGFLATRNFTLVFLVDGITSLIAMVVLAGGIPQREARSREERKKTESAFAPLFDRRYQRLLLGVIPLFIVIFQMDSTVSLFVVRTLKQSPTVYGFLGVINTLMIVFTEIPLNHMTAHWPPARAMTIGALFIAAGFGGYGLAAGFPGLAICTATWTIGEMLAFPAMTSFISELAGDHNRGAYMGVYTLSVSIAFTTGPWLGTTLISLLPTTVYWSLWGIFGLAAALLFARVTTDKVTVTTS